MYTISLKLIVVFEVKDCLLVTYLYSHSGFIYFIIKRDSEGHIFINTA